MERNWEAIACGGVVSEMQKEERYFKDKKG